jgi:hypothetical protein
MVRVVTSLVVEALVKKERSILLVDQLLQRVKKEAKARVGVKKPKRGKSKMTKNDLLNIIKEEVSFVLEKKKKKGKYDDGDDKDEKCDYVPCDESKEELNEYALIDEEFDLYEQLQDAVTEDDEHACPECLYELFYDSMCGCEDLISEAEYKGRKVKLNKRLPGDVKKFKAFVTGCGKDKSRVTKINFGDKNMKIKKSNPKRRKSFRARHKCKTAKDKCTPRYWSCKAW